MCSTKFINLIIEWKFQSEKSKSSRSTSSSFSSLTPPWSSSVFWIEQDGSSTPCSSELVPGPSLPHLISDSIRSKDKLELVHCFYTNVDF